MHVLIGFCIFVGLIAFALGSNVAQKFIGAVLFSLLAAVLMFVGYCIAVAFSEPPASGGYGTDSAKIPEETPYLSRICEEYRTHPNDAPRMCFAVLDRMGR